MAEDYFKHELALNPATDAPVPYAVATVYALTDTDLVTPLAITDISDIPMSNLVAGPNGIYPPFKVVSGETDVAAVSGAGTLITPITSVQGNKGDDGAPGPTGAGVPDTATAGEGQVVRWNGTSTEWGDGGDSSATWSTLPGKPALFPSETHTHPATGISDATSVGRSVMTAASQAAARAALGAAPSTVVTFPGFGTTAGTAVPGNRQYAATEIAFDPTGTPFTATTVDGALEQVSGLVGGAGGGDEVAVYYSGGAYPAQSTPAAGVKRRHFYGPVPYTGTTYAGVLDLYDRVALA